MMDWQFDRNGFVKPYACITVSVEEFKKRLVSDLNTSRRTEIFNQYDSFVESLKALSIESPFYQWVNGSFLNIKSYPNDIDIVTFLPENVFAAVEKQLKVLFVDKTNFPLLDLYFVPIFPGDHKNFFLYQSDRLYWLHLFSYSKRDLVSGKRFEKGFFQINFDI